MKPGLHPLSCSRCGAPLDPSEKPRGEVVRCEHCGQPHLWVAPGKVEAQPSPSPVATGIPAKSNRVRTMTLLGAALAFVVIGMMVVGGFVYARGRGGGRGWSPYAPAEAGMPIVIGDLLHMQIDNHSCEVRVLDVMADGRVVGVACQSQEASPLARALLGVEAFSEQPHPQAEAGDIVLTKASGSWVRRVVVGPEPDAMLRVRPVVDGKGKEEVVAKASVLRVQRRSAGACYVDVPLPEQAPLEPGDVLSMRDGTVAYRVHVDSVKGADLVVKKNEELLTRRLSSMFVNAVCATTPLLPKSPILVKDGQKWLRRTMVADEGTWVSVEASEGSAPESRAKENMLALRDAPR